MNPTPFTLIAHRGASAEAPENTFASFDLALEQGVTDLELDVHLTRGGVPVVIHDDTVDRTTNGKGPVRERTLDELKRLDAGAWFHKRFAGQRIPTLAEVLERYGSRATLHVELKEGDPEVAHQAARLVKAWNLLDRVAFISFWPQQLAQVLKMAPGHPTGYLVQRFTPEVLEEAVRLGVWSVAPPAPSITPELVGLANPKGLRVWAWAVRSEQDLRRVVEAGCDGCTVDWPARGLKILEELKARA